jgi:GNAT superfamily N-acetyltransferase
VRHMDDARLADLEHANLIESIALAAANVPGSLIRREAGVAVIASGVRLRLFNQVVVEDVIATGQALAAGVATMRDRGAHFVVNLRAGIDDRFVPLMAELRCASLYPDAWMPGMAMHPIPPGLAAPQPAEGGPGGDPSPRGEIRRVTDAAGVADLVRAAAEGFTMAEPIMRSLVTPAFLGVPGAALYVGYLDGRPVSSGLGVRTGRCIGVYAIATVREARGRGFGRRMTERVVRDGAAEGCDVAVLQASDMGLPMYRRLGFRTVAEHLAFGEPGGA